VIKAVFSASLLQSSVSHDRSEVNIIWWFVDQDALWNCKIRLKN